MYGSSPTETSPLRSKYQIGFVRVSATSGRSRWRVFQTWCEETMSDSPPSRARAMQRRPTMSESSAWKNCLFSNFY